MNNRKNNKRVIAAVLAVVLGVSGAIVSNSAASAAQKKVRIGVLMYNMSSFVTQGKQGMDAYAKVNNIQMLWNSANNDVATQANQFDQLITQKVDAILLNPVQATSLQPQMAKAKAAKIPVFAVNQPLADNSGMTSSVLPDDVAAGAQEMQQMADKLGGKGNIVILLGPLGGSAELNRLQGINNVLAKYPDIKVLAKDTANWARDEAATKTANWLTSFGDKLNAIVSENDDMGLGAVQALKEAKKTLPVVGIDGIQDGLAAVKSGAFIGTSLQHGRVELTAGLAVAAMAARGQKVKKVYDYIMPAVTPANAASFEANVVTGVDAFIKRLPALIAKNLASGNISNEN
jgi:ribose transport system substrate-binding protein